MLNYQGKSASSSAKLTVVLMGLGLFPLPLMIMCWLLNRHDGCALASLGTGNGIDGLFVVLVVVEAAVVGLLLFHCSGGDLEK